MRFSVPSEEGRDQAVLIANARADMRSYSVTERGSKADFRQSFVSYIGLCLGLANIAIYYRPKSL